MSYTTAQRLAVANMAEAIGLGHYPYGNGTGTAVNGLIDCSGVPVAAWRQIGVSLPHNSEQLAALTKIMPVTAANVAKLLPGDLVYYYGTVPSAVTHVAVFLRRWALANSPTRMVIAQATDTAHGSEIIKWDKYVPPTGLGFIGH